MKYTEIEFWGSIDEAVNELQKYKDEYVYIHFNGHKLYSDTVTLDSAYKEVTGMTKQEYLDMLQKEKDDYERELREHQENIPNLIEIWKQKGREILDEDRWQKWDEVVPIRLDDLYRGMELGACLDIVKILNNNGTLEEAKKEIEKQNHSGMSFNLVCAMVNVFCNRGEEFVKYVR